MAAMPHDLFVAPAHGRVEATVNRVAPPTVVDILRPDFEQTMPNSIGKALETGSRPLGCDASRQRLSSVAC